jgi:hypothetical protein
MHSKFKIARLASKQDIPQEYFVARYHKVLQTCHLKTNYHISSLLL